ncbi:MAG: hypothetical protein GTO51_06090 [Candidatus Latescibacteria bacterium]|nr:hypothetical protein [Candidatus Latescibacterota bacterium]NIM21362.1 hypothetical protein [Candidatus Latescibacterota bacterium]NIM65543.1 hypothetical protein [Candidatus Latescibacterota bacterium]NIO01923.1 hypothetical protein [Candidatus Latescibacterota bacterium]NIO28736.1 hypothetical protein [Candidatus Latescibacterota bacterium]
MVWGLAAALAAGAFYRFSVFWAIPLLLSIPVFFPKNAKLRVAVIVITASALFCYAQQATESLRSKQQYADEFLFGGGSTRRTMDGWVSGFPQVGRGRVTFRFRTDLDGTAIDVIVYGKTPGISFGDSLRIVAERVKRRRQAEKEDSRADSYLLARGAAAAVRTKKDGITELPGCSGNTIKRHFFWPLHERLRQEIARRLGSKSGIPLALLLGEKGELDSRIKRTFVNLGISHLLALSGMHLGLVAAAVLLVLGCLRLKNPTALFIVLTIYVCTVGEVVSLFRAYVMATALIAARIIHRPMKPIAALGNAVFLILLWAPHTFFSIGFQLSFTATLGVLLCIQRISFESGRSIIRKLLKYVTSTIVVGVFVQVYLAALLVHHFGRLSIVAPVATLVFFPFVFVVLFLSFSCALPGVLCSGAGDVVAPALEHTSSLFRWLLLFADDLAPPLVHVPAADVILYCAGITVIWCSKRLSLRTLAGLILIALAFIKSLLGAS